MAPSFDVDRTSSINCDYKILIRYNGLANSRDVRRLSREIFASKITEAEIGNSRKSNSHEKTVSNPSHIDQKIQSINNTNNGCLYNFNISTVQFSLLYGLTRSISNGVFSWLNVTRRIYTCI